MLLSNVAFILLIIIEGCAGPLPAGQGCSAKNFSLRIPYEKLDQCEAARKGMNATEGVNQFIIARCLTVSRDVK
jgi:hypothetical protein